jgi:squalene-hopene/tetraprenyl-beta-curcumene cyclase
MEVLATILALSPLLACSHPATKVPTSWNRKTAATYLDDREDWWAGSMVSARDHSTFCVSCHTALPYALARPALRSALAEGGPSSGEQKLVDDVIKRVRMWKEASPYYSDQGYGGKAEESRGTEAVLNALILANYDAQRGQLSDDTRAAFDNMWALQRRTGDETGSWPWLQFDEEPWEAKDSVYYGATLAALATGMAPGSYASTAGIQSNLMLLRQYLNREMASQSTLNRVFLLWASTKLPGLLNSEQQNAIVQEVLTRQQSDGGWRLASITWTWNRSSARTMIQMWLREDGTPLRGKSDGVATGLITFVMQEAGISRNDLHLQRGLSWLMNNQTSEGFWPALSVNKKRDPSSGTGRFMSDAATSFAVLSLTKSETGMANATTSGN